MRLKRLSIFNLRRKIVDIKILARIMGWILFFLYTGSATASAKVIIIANKEVEGNLISRKTLAEIYKNEKSLWDSGMTIRVVLQVVGNTHREFTEKIIEVPPAKLKNIWRQVIFTGTGNMPKLLNTEKDIVKYVSVTKGAIGYIDSETPHTDVKVLDVEE